MLLFISEFWSETPVVPSIIHSINQEVLVYGYYVIMLYYFGYTSTEYVCMAVENQPHVTIPKWPKEAHTVRKWSKKRAP